MGAKITPNSFILKYFIGKLCITPYSSKTWRKYSPKSLILKDRSKGVLITIE